MNDKKNQGMKKKKEKLWVFTFKVSLKYHADIFAGRQIGHGEN